MKTIFTNGCFDIIHRGHLELLEYCASLGYVIVGLNSDDSVRTLKGDARPINNQKDRKYLLHSLKYVDKVIIFNEETPYRLIKEIKPDIIVKGGDYTRDAVVGGDIAEVRIFKTIDGYSTTKTLESINRRR
tara:strand:- start:1472 stop:1864 length:393 start_codon:yes stop_codon:yes gene_type:complete